MSAALLACCSATGDAGAQTPVEEARTAYDRGARAYDRGDWSTAARELARADALVSNPVALGTAIKAATRADDAALAMTLVERAELRAAAGASDEGLSSAAQVAREKFAARVASLTIRCTVRPSCRATLDGAPVTVDTATWVTAGEHAVSFVTAAGEEVRRVDLAPGGRLVVEPRMPEAPPPSPQPAPALRPDRVRAGGISPIWFWTSAGLTAIAAGASIASAVDWQNKRDEFLAAPTEDKGADGEAVQTRTNVLFAVAGAGVIATAALGIFFVRWSPPAPTSTAVRVSARPLGAAVEVTH